MLAGQLAVSVGGGVLSSVTVVFLVRSAGLDAAAVGVGLAAAGLLAFLPLLGIGPVLDRLGGRPVALLGGLVAVVSTAGFALVDSVGTLVVVEGISNGALTIMYVAQRSLAGQLLTGTDRIRYVARNRAVSNLGVAAGALIAAPALVLDDRRAYLLTFGAAALAVAAALPCLWFSPVPAATAADAWQRPWVALRDVRYLAMALLCGLLGARHRILVAAVPLWIVTATAAPAGLTSVLMLVNTGVVIVLQIPVSARADTLAGSARAMRYGGLAFAVAFAAFALAAEVPRRPAVGLLVLAVVPFTFGEMWTAAASWTYSYELAPPESHGRYQAAFALGRLGGELAGPLLVPVAVAGAVGWAAVSAFFLGGCTLAGVLAPWAQKSRTGELTR